MKLLVTGGAGFIGSNFVENFTRNLYPEISKIIILDKLTYAGTLSNLTSSLMDSRVSFIEGDICDSDLVSRIAQSIDGIINFAAESHVDRSISNSLDFVRTNILGVQNLLEATRNHDLKIFLQVSTDEVYGSIDAGSWDENSPLLPNSPYAASKASADLLVRAYHVTYGINTIITRCSNNYGPRQYTEKIIPLFVTQLKAGKNVPIYGDGTNVRDWLHVDDHCNGIYLALTKGESGEIYNIGGGTELTNLELTKRILEHLHLPLSKISYVDNRLGHDQRYSVSWEKLKKLGYVPERVFNEELPKTIQSFESSTTSED